MSDEAPRELTAPLHEAWNLGASVSGWNSSPFLAGDGRLVVRDIRGFVVAVDGATGARHWSYPWWATPLLIHEDAVLVRVEDELHWLNLESGRPRESLYCPSVERAVLQGRVLIGCGRGHELLVLLAFDLDRRRRLWAVRRADAGEPSTLAAGDGFVMISSSQPPMTRGYDARTGRERWKREGVWLGMPDVRGREAVGFFGDKVARLSLEDGRTRWEADGCPGTLYGDRYYCCDAAGDCRILDARSGRLVRRWDLTAQLPKTLRHAVFQGPILASETHVFVGSRDALFAFARDTAQYVWHHQPKAASVGPTLLAAEGRLYYASGHNRLSCLAPASKKRR